MRKADEATRELLQELENSPLVAELKAKRAQELIAKRGQWADRIEELEAQRAEQIPPLREAYQIAQEAVAAAQESLKAAEIEASHAYRAINRADDAIDNEIRTLRGELLANHDPLIDEHIQFFRDEHDRVRNMSPTEYKIDERLDLVCLERAVSRESNYPAICARLEYCRECVRLLEACKLAPGYDPELFARLKADLPSLDAFTEYRGKRATLRDIPDLVRAKLDSIFADEKVSALLSRPLPRPKKRGTRNGDLGKQTRAYSPKPKRDSWEVVNGRWVVQ